MDWLRRSARLDPDAPAVITAAATLSYGDLDDLADRVAAAVRGAGPALGERVAFWGEQNLRAAAAAWGIPRSGAWAVPVSTRLPAAAAMEQTRRAGVRGLWALASDGDLADLRTASPADGGGPPDPRARYVVFTSGSGGTPTGVVLSGAAIEASVAGSRANLGNGSDDPWLCVLPTSHVGGLSILWRCAEAGAPVVLEERFDAGRVAGLLAEGEVAYASLVPTMLRRVLAAHPGPYRGVKGVLVGGGPSDAGLLRRAMDAGLPVLATYGSTETCSQVATVAPGEQQEALGTAGRPLDGFEVRVSGDGRIEVRGPAVATETIEGPFRAEGDWLRTGDLGRLDSSGRLVVIGRADRVIVTGGVNVHPDAVEAVLAGHPAIADVRVFGVPDPEWGTAVTAEVVVAGGARFEEGPVAAWARSRLTGAEVPKRWQVTGRIDRTELGKHRA
ncbi:MAG: acyl--CoA ligase [Actinobacteria bacterium]|nr:acyl--CoA ligase [Actinomycetota bacterium]MBU1494293.1 acyl--CoA ligase [Actinomycetota bacterium]